jgi:cell division protein FtsB
MFSCVRTCNLRQQETKMQEELDGLRDTLQSKRQHFTQVKSELDKLKSLC